MQTQEEQKPVSLKEILKQVEDANTEKIRELFSPAEDGGKPKPLYHPEWD